MNSNLFEYKEYLAFTEIPPISYFLQVKKWKNKAGSKQKSREDDLSRSSKPNLSDIKSSFKPTNSQTAAKSASHNAAGHTLAVAVNSHHGHPAKVNHTAAALGNHVSKAGSKAESNSAKVGFLKDFFFSALSGFELFMAAIH